MIILFAFPVSAESSTYGDNIKWEFDMSTGTLTISGKGDMEEFPDSAPWADYVDYIKKVVITEGVTSISKNSFKWCKNLESIEIPKTLTKIGNWFLECYSFRSIKIPEHIVSIEEDAFSGCPYIEKFEVDKNNKYYTNDSEGVLYNKNKTVIMKFPSEHFIDNYVIPDSVEKISAGAFVDTKVPNIVIGKNVKTIGDYAFQFSYIESMYIPDGVEQIGEACFAECDYLKSIRIPGSVTEIKIQTCFDCKSLEEVILCEGLETIRWNGFESTNIKEITIPSTVKKIEGRSFAYTKNLKEFKISEGNRYYQVIDGCIYDITGKKLVAVPSSKKYLNLPSDLITIESGACVGNSLIKSIEIPETVTIINDSAFMYCESLNKIVIKSPNTEVRTWAFNCPNIFTGENNSNRVIYAYVNSFAHEYAANNGFKFKDIETEPIEDDKPTNGDVDDDGKISIKDATAIQKHVANLIVIDDEMFACADTDKDGKITVKDATRIQKFLASIIPEL